jgi:hydroxymethylpyrimidine/phosphomethylpyrimidine kinase
MRTVLAIAGLDPSAGAGILADARVSAEHDVRLVGVTTALTVQDTSGVRAANPVSAEIVEEQLSALMQDVELDAVKIGMLGNAAIARAVARALAATRAPVVWDPVIMPSRGGVILMDGVPEALEALLPEVRLLTPNLAEAAALTGRGVATEADMEDAGRALVARGAAAVLVKGGHLAGDAVDILVDGDVVQHFREARVQTGPMHGTGCVLSTAIACQLARGATLADAITRAKHYLTKKLRAPLTPGRGARTVV